MPKKPVQYANISFDSVEVYWREYLAPNALHFMREPSTRTLINATLATWHLQDWVWHEQHPGEDPRNNPAFQVYRNTCPELKLLGDVADAAKHCGLSRIVQVRKAKRIRRQASYFGSDYFGASYYGGGDKTFRLVLGGGNNPEFAAVLRTAIDFWRAYLPTKNLPSPFADDDTRSQ